VVFALLVAAATGMWLRSRTIHVDQHNVNDDWDPVAAPATEERVPVTAS